MLSNADLASGRTCSPWFHDLLSTRLEIAWFKSGAARRWSEMGLVWAVRRGQGQGDP
jgi:hypothetical protein